jgi:hypothetical protein
MAAREAYAFQAGKNFQKAGFTGRALAEVRIDGGGKAVNASPQQVTQALQPVVPYRAVRVWLAKEGFALAGKQFSEGNRCSLGRREICRTHEPDPCGGKRRGDNRKASLSQALHAD